MAKRMTRVHPEADIIIRDIIRTIKNEDNLRRFVTITILDDQTAAVEYSGATRISIKDGWLWWHRSGYLFKKLASARLVKALESFQGEHTFINDKR